MRLARSIQFCRGRLFDDYGQFIQPTEPSRQAPPGGPGVKGRDASCITELSLLSLPPACRTEKKSFPCSQLLPHPRIHNPPSTHLLLTTSAPWPGSSGEKGCAVQKSGFWSATLGKSIAVSSLNRISNGPARTYAAIRLASCCNSCSGALRRTAAWYCRYL